MHTAYSLDAYIGGTRQTPNMAYRFAKGEAFEIGGTKRRLARPLGVCPERYTNDIGAPALIGSRTDADFSPSEGAFDYARALEIPTPRWTTYEAVAEGLPPLEGVPATIQERAWGSPIWYAP